MGSCFGPIFGGCHQGPITSSRPIFNPVLGLRLGPTHLLFQTSSYLIVLFIIQKIYFIIKLNLFQFFLLLNQI